MLRAARHAIALLIVALAMTMSGLAAGTSGATPPQLQTTPPKGQWTVVYDFQDSGMARSLVGTFNIDGQFLRYRSIDAEITWNVNLKDVDVIFLEDTHGPAIVVSGIIIDTLQNGERLRRRIAPVDESMAFLTPVVLFGLLNQRLTAFRNGGPKDH